MKTDDLIALLAKDTPPAPKRAIPMRTMLVALGGGLIAFAVMLFATLSFLGLGAQPPASEWGLMVAEARRFMHLSPWMILWPSLAVALVAIGFNLLGDGLRDALNPRN